MSTWQDFVTAALLGSEKATPPPLPPALADSLTATSALEPGARFLTHAGALALWRRAGWRPPQDTAESFCAEPETTRLLSSASATHLRIMLSGRCAEMLEEWLAEVAQRGMHVAPELLPDLLDQAKRKRDLRPLVLAAGGKRATWLAAQNPDWAYAPLESPELWETGHRDQRLALLRTWRHRAPAEARAKLEAVWKTEPAANRVLFLKECQTGLSLEDAPFLESLLDDRSKEVRALAVDLLARLPDSPLAQRMTARVAPLLIFKPERLFIPQLPGEVDAAARRDGLDPKALAHDRKFGEKASLLVQMLSAVPLTHWTSTTGQTPEALVRGAQKHEFASAVLTGWTWAALRQRDAAWAEVLMEAGDEALPHFSQEESLLDLLPPARRAEQIVTLLRTGVRKSKSYEFWHNMSRQLLALPLPWPDALAREVLLAFRTEAPTGVPLYGNQVNVLLSRLPRAILAEAAQGWPDGEAGAPYVEFLTFRRDALTALSQS